MHNRAAKEPHRLLRGCRGAALPALEQRPTPPTLQITNILPSREMHNRAAKEPHRLLKGYRGAALPSLARRSHTSNLQTSNIQLVISKLTRFTLNRNSQQHNKRTSPPLEGMQGSDAPRSRATVAHLRFRKQAAPCSSQTLHWNAVRYPQ